MKRRFDYDLAVLGGGTAGGEAALIAAKNGLKVALIEADKWGGADLNYTGTPLDALFHATQNYKNAIDGARFGLSSANLRYNYPTLMNWKNLATRRAHANSRKDFEDAGIVCIEASARFISAHEISVGQEVIHPKQILVATGASILDTGIKIPENVDYWLPDAVLKQPRAPKSIMIVGAGSTGCEFAQYFSTLGSEVVIADIAGRLLPHEDEEVGQVLDEVFNQAKIKVLTQSRVIALEKDGIQKKVIFLRGGQEKSIHVDEVLLCTGSAANVDIGLENAGIKFNRNGVQVDAMLHTSVKGIYAAGDVIGGHSSTEKALVDARVAVAHILGRSKAVVDYRGIIRMTNIIPAVAEVGMTEDDCLRNDSRYKKVVLPLSDIRKANTSDFYSGFIKIITGKNGKILGGTVMAPHAGLIAQELALAMRYDMTTYELAAAPHLVGDWSELVHAACALVK